MYCHLVAVEVRVERAASERVKFDRSALDEHGFERLNTETVKRRRTVKKHRVFFDNAFEYAPDFLAAALYETLCALDIVSLALGDEFVHNERLEEFERHFFRQTALIHFEFGSDDDNATTGVVHAFAEEVLTETTLLAAKKSGQRFEFAVARARNRFAAATVIDKRVDGFLQHTLFVADDNVRSGKFD